MFLIEQNSKSGEKAKHYLSQRLPGISQLNAQPLVNLTDLNLDFAEKIEGLTQIQDGVFAFINDNDFKPENRTVLGILTVPITPKAQQRKAN